MRKNVHKTHLSVKIWNKVQRVSVAIVKKLICNYFFVISIVISNDHNFDLKYNFLFMDICFVIFNTQVFF